jgi:hypothetical protein
MEKRSDTYQIATDIQWEYAGDGQLLLNSSTIFICLSYWTVIRIIAIAFSPIFLVAFPNFIKTFLGTFGDFKMRHE